MKTSMFVSSRVSSRSSSRVMVGMGFDGTRTSADERGVLWLHFKYGRKRMAFPTADVRVETGAASLFTKSRHLDAAPECNCPRTGHLAAQLQEFAGVCPANGWDRAGAAQVAPPGCAEQAALFMIAAAVVVAVEIFTFRTSRCFHFRISELPRPVPSEARDRACGRV